MFASLAILDSSLCFSQLYGIAADSEELSSTQQLTFMWHLSFSFKTKDEHVPGRKSEIQQGGLPSMSISFGSSLSFDLFGRWTMLSRQFFCFAFLVVLSRKVNLLSYYVAGSGNSWESWVSNFVGMFLVVVNIFSQTSLYSVEIISFYASNEYINQ